MRTIFCMISFLGAWLNINAQTSPTAIIADGYTDKLSYNPGDTASVYINAPESFNQEVINLFSINDEKVGSVTTNVFPQVVSNTEPWEKGFGYQVTFKYVIPALRSGVYYWGDDRKISFIVKDRYKKKNITIVYPTNTEAAYNNAGGKSLYEFNSSYAQKAHAVSFQRPLSNWAIVNMRSYCNAFLRWFYQMNYHVQMISDADLDNHDEFENSKIIIIVGHSEYWTRAARENFDQFVNDGKDAVVLSGNTMWWQARYNKEKTKLICYKFETIADSVSSPLLKTINWTSPSLNYPVLSSIGVDFPHGAYGMKMYHGWYGYKILKPDSPLLDGTDLHFGDTLSCQSDEYDGTLFSGFDAIENPIVDSAALGFCKIELVGYDWGKRIDTLQPQKSYGTFVVFQKEPASGKIINTAFSHWCSKNGQDGAAGGFGGKDSALIKIISLNMINKLLNREQVFSSPPAQCSLSANEVAPGPDFIIHPNPSNGVFIIEKNSKHPALNKLEIWNVFGQKIYSSGNQSVVKSTIDLSPLSTGIYFLTIHAGDQVFTRKILKQP